VPDLSELLSIVDGFQWDLGNSGKSGAKHGVTQSEAEESFFNHPVVVVADTRHSMTEPRFAMHGVTNAGRALTIIFTVRGALVRVISARNMSRRERREYEKAT